MSTQDPNQAKKAQELTDSEAKETNGGGLLGGDNMTSLTGMTQGYLNISRTDEDGQTESLNTDLGTGSMFDSRQND